jgi:hypothetical protein
VHQDAVSYMAHVSFCTKTVTLCPDIGRMPLHADAHVSFCTKTVTFTMLRVCLRSKIVTFRHVQAVVVAGRVGWREPDIDQNRPERGSGVFQAGAVHSDGRLHHNYPHLWRISEPVVHRLAQKQSPLGKILHISTGDLHKNSHPNVEICTYPQAVCTKTVTLLHKNSRPNHWKANDGAGFRPVNVFKGLLKVYLNKVVNVEKFLHSKKTTPPPFSENDVKAKKP